MKASPDVITSLLPHQRFVFGSNQAGIHGAGAARFAARFFGAELEVGEGPTGNCYAIPTKDYDIVSRSLREIRQSVHQFLDYARSKPEIEFLVTQIGCGLAGFTPTEIAPMFVNSPENVLLPQSFLEYIIHEE